MQPTSPVSTTSILLTSLVAGFLIGLPFLLLWAYQQYLGAFLRELRDESTGGLSGFVSVFVRKLGVLNRPLLWPAYETRVRKNLIRAGDPYAFAPEDLLAMQELGLFVGLVVGSLAVAGVRANPIWILVPTLLGAGYPLIWLRDQVLRRHLRISRALPYNLDLLTLSVEAGLDFTAALARVVEKGKAGPLRDELALVLKQLKLGKTREETLKAMSARVDLPAMTSFVTALVQADRMGTPLGRVLRLQSTQLRVERTQRAEKLANEAPVKMLFPLIACIFPTVFMVLFGPVVFSFIFGNALGGGG